MTHVRITSKDNGGYSLTVDEHDLSYHILAGGKIELPAAGGAALVHVTLVADTLDIDLDDGIVTDQEPSNLITMDWNGDYSAEILEIQAKARAAAAALFKRMSRLEAAVGRGARQGIADRPHEGDEGDGVAV